MIDRIKHLKVFLDSQKGPALSLIGPFFDLQSLPPGPLVFVDKGAHFQNGHPGFSVGDGDSSEIELDQLLSKEKDFSDLAYCLSQIPNHFSTLNLCGFLGHRKDHELMNLAEVHRFLKKTQTPIQVHFDQKISAYSKGRWQVKVEGVFSLFAFESVEVTLEGDCKYKILKNKALDALSSNGLSNEGFGFITIICDGPIFLFY